MSLLSTSSSYGGENSRALILKGGLSYYFDTSIGSIGGGGGTSRWDVGPAFRVEILAENVIIGLVEWGMVLGAMASSIAGTVVTLI